MKKIVAHFSLYYFELSENWIHTQVKYTEGWNRLVFTNKAKNLDSVDWTPEIYDRSQKLSVGTRLLDSIVMKLTGYYPSFFFRLKNENVQLIHAHFGTMGYLCSGMAKRLDIPLVTTFYGYDASLLPKEKPAWKSKYRKLFDNGTLFLAEGPAMGKKLENLGCPPDKIIVHHLGVELDKYRVKKVYPAENHLRMLMVGRFVEKKGFIYGLRAFSNFLENGGSGNLTIYGDSNSTAESDQIKKELFEFVDDHNLRDSVSFPGLIPLEKLQKEYSKYDLFLAPSIKATNGDDEGGAPVTIIEAGASGIPVIGSRHCDIPEIIKHGKTGFLADEKDVDKLTRHILHLHRNPELQKSFGQNGVKHISRNFSAIKQGKILSSIYKDCLNGDEFS